MPKSIWSGLITFGLVSIPVKLYSATESSRVSFHLLHKECQSRIKEQRWCPTCERQVDWDELEKGFEYTKGEYVVLTSEDMEKLPLPSKNSIEVSEFVDNSEIDPIYFDKTYYLEADKSANKPFALFMKALSDKAVYGIGSLTIRTRERPCLLRPLGDKLIVTTLLYPNEIRIDLEASVPEAKLSRQEQAMAADLIDAMTGAFDPDKFEDHYETALHELIEAKIEGQAIKMPKRAKKEKVVDLMDALRASIKDVKGSAKSKTGRKRTSTRSRRAS